MTTTSLRTDSPDDYAGKIFGPTMLSNTHGDAASFEPKPDITPIEAVRIAELFSLYTLAQHSGTELDFVCFIAEHAIYNHFVLTEFREEFCSPTVKPGCYYAGNKLINLASDEFSSKYTTD